MTAAEESRGRVLANLKEALAFLDDKETYLHKIWSRGRVAHVAFEPGAGSPFGNDGQKRYTIATVPRDWEAEWADKCDPVTVKFVAGDEPNRTVMWVRGSCVLLRLTDKGWAVEPGSTDLELAN